VRPPPTTLPALPAAPQLHPSQGLKAIDDANQACSVSYWYGRDQYLAFAAQATKTTFDPHSLDLPSVGAPVGFYHACLGFPVNQTWLDGSKAGNLGTFNGLTYSNIARYCRNSDKTILGHLAQQCQNVCSTQPRPPRAPTGLPLHAIEPPAPELASNKTFVNVFPLSKLYTNDTGCVPVRACSGNQYIMIAYHADGNLIIQQPFKNKSNAHCLAAYNIIMTRLAARGLSVDLQIMENEASAVFKQAITFAWRAKLQLVPPVMHCCNQAKRTI
jgi:hypothetical protein